MANDEQAGTTPGDTARVHLEDPAGPTEPAITLDGLPGGGDDRAQGQEPGGGGGGRRRGLLIGAVAAAVLALVAVALVLGGRGDDDSVRTVSLAEAAAASQASTARIEVFQQAANGVATSGEGEIDFTARRLHLRFDRPDAALDAMPEIYDDAPEEVRVMVSADQWLMVEDRAYLHSGDRWWDLGPASASEEQALDFWSLSTSMLDQLGAMGEVTTIGRDQVRGAVTTHYRATDDQTAETYDVWIDDDDRAVRVQTTGVDGQANGAGATTLELFDFGLPVTIEEPSDAEPFGARAPVDVELKEAASGQEGGVTWTLSTGRLADGRQCVQVATDPALDGEQVQITGDGGSSSAPVAAGGTVGPSCGPVPLGDADDGGGFDSERSYTADYRIGDSGAILLAVGGRDGDVHYLAGLLGEGANVKLTFAGGREEPLVDHDGAFVVVFSGDDWPTLLRPDGGGGCELAGDDRISGGDGIC